MSAPEYIFLISQLAGEQRFASTVAKRLESLVCIIVVDVTVMSDMIDVSRFHVLTLVLMFSICNTDTFLLIAHSVQ